MSATFRPFALVALISATVVLGLNMGVRQTFGLFLEPMTEALAISHSAFSMAIAIQNLIWGALQPACAALADRYGTGKVLAAGGVCYVSGLIVMGLVQTPLGLHLGAGLLVGIAVAATGFPLVLAAVARIAPPEKRSSWLGIAAAGGSIGQFVLLPGAQGLIGGFGWVAALVILAVGAALIVPCAAALAGKAAAASEHDTQTLRGAIGEAGRHGGYLLLTAGFFVCGFHVAFMATHLPAYITSVGLSPFVGATALSLIGFFNIIGSFAAGWLGGRFRKKMVLSGIYLARSVAIAFLMILPVSDVTIYLFASAFGLLWLGTVPLTGGLVGEIFGARYMATLFGFVMFSHQIGAFFGAWLGGLSYDLTGSYNAVWMLALLLGLMAAALHWPIRDKPVERLLRQEAAERADAAERA